MHLAPLAPLASMYTPSLPLIITLSPNTLAAFVPMTRPLPPPLIDIIPPSFSNNQTYIDESTPFDVSSQEDFLPLLSLTHSHPRLTAMNSPELIPYSNGNTNGNPTPILTPPQERGTWG